MKTFVSLLIFITIAPNSPAQAWDWAKEGDPIINLITETDQNDNVYLCGSFINSCTIAGLSLTSPDSMGAFLIQLDSAGTLNWYKKLSADYIEIPDMVIENGNIFLAGSFRSVLKSDIDSLSSAGNSDIFFSKWDLGGNLLLLKADGSAANERTKCFDVSANGILISGYFSQGASISNVNLTSANSQNLFIAKYDLAGQNLWVKETVGDSGASASSQWIKLIPTEEFFLVANFNNCIDFGDTIMCLAGGGEANEGQLLLKYDSNGNFLSFVYRLSGYMKSGQGIETDAYGNVYTIQTVGHHHSTDALRLSKFSSQGDLLWERSVGGVSDYAGPCIGQKIKIRGQHIFVAGYYRDEMYLPMPFRLSGRGVFLFEYDSSGSMLSLRNGITDKYYFPNITGLAADNENNVYLTGLTNQEIFFGDLELNTSADIINFLVKLDHSKSESAPSIIVDPASYSSCVGKSFTVFSTIKNVGYIKWYFYGRKIEYGETYLYMPDNYVGYGAAGIYDAYVIIENSSQTDSIFFDDMIHIYMEGTPVIKRQGNSLVCINADGDIDSIFGYNWRHSNGYPASLNKGPVFMPPFAGDYHVFVYYTNGCIGRSEPYHFIPYSLVSGEKFTKDFEIFPNPSTGHFTIESSEPISSITITNLMGEKIFVQSLKESENKIEVQLNVTVAVDGQQGVSSGMYFLEITCNEKRTIKKIILK